jgi:hypothetical protein
VSKPQEALKAEYLELAKRFGYIPEFPTSVAQGIHELEEAERQGSLSPMGRDMLRESKMVDPSNYRSIDEGMDPGGFSDFLNYIAISECVSAATLDLIYCAEFPTGEFNACARRSAHGYLCLFNHGLRNLVFRTSLAVFSDIGQGGTSKPSFREMLLYVSEICLRYLTEQEGPPESDINHGETSIRRGGTISRAIRLFVVAHEVAHVELGHLDTGVHHALSLPGGSLDVIGKSVQQEYEADALGQEILTRVAEKTAPNPDGSGGSLLFVCGGLCFLTIEMIVSCVQQFMLGKPKSVSPTHPSSPDRISALYKTLEDRISATQQKQLRSIHGVYLRVYNAFLETMPLMRQTRNR